LGKNLLRKLNEIGIVADVSQLSRAGVLQAVELSNAPVIASHSGIRAIVDHPRNLSNEELDAIARKGGVVQVVAYSHYVRPTPSDWLALPGQLAREFGLSPADDPVTKLDPKRFAAYDRRLSAIHARAPKASLEHYLDSIDYAVKRIGIDHVGLASDFNHGGGVSGWMDSSQSLNVTLELLRRGYTEEQIAKLWGENFLRVWQAVLDASRERAVLSSVRSR
jgi:microsomal dipeptidase-like Zn-dependent dipeptidase